MTRFLLPTLLGLAACGSGDPGGDDDASSSAGADSQADSQAASQGSSQEATEGATQADESGEQSGGASTSGQTDSESSSSGEASSETAADSQSETSTDDAAEDAGDEGASTSDTGDDSGGWSSLSELPEARQEISVVTFDGDIYVVGGFNQDRQATPDLRIYNVAGDDWRSGPSLPEALHHANVAALGDTLYVLGYLDSTWQAQAAIYTLKAGGSWQTLATELPEGRARGSSGVAVLGEEICLMGGLRGRAVKEADCFAPNTSEWRSLPDLPAPSDHLVASAYDEQLFIFGGRDTAIADHVAQVHVLPPGADTWQARSEMPTSRAGMAGTRLDDAMYVFGGEGNPADPKGIFSACERYDFASDSWSALPEMQVARHGTGAAAVMGRIFVPAGADAEAFAAIASFEVFDP